MRVVFFPRAHNTLIKGVLRCARDLHDDRFLHLRAGDHAHQLLPNSALADALAGLWRVGGHCFVCHYAFLNSTSRNKVFTRAKSFFASRSFFKPSAWPAAIGKRSRKICSASSRSWTVSSSEFIPRYFSTLRATRVPPSECRTSSRWAICA